MDATFLGIDIGTSSVKVLARTGRREESVRVPYAADRAGPAAWSAAIDAGVAGIRGSLGRVAGIGLSGQTNTYVLWRPGVPDGDLAVVPWTAPGGARELAEVLRLPPGFFVEHISMPHPAMVSYPAPRILWMQRALAPEWKAASALLQPKDWVYLELTGRLASDPFTWRGLAHLGDGSFHGPLLRSLGLAEQRLPPLHAPWEAPGSLTAEAASRLGIPAGVPVFLGCNDFFASLAGMGVLEAGQWFDVAGSSEHVGRVETRGPAEVFTPLVYGPGLAHCVHYGVTAASGVSLEWGLRLFGGDAAPADAAAAPLFLPYLQGERAPHFDPDARGAFVGLHQGHGPADMLYAVCEGVAFSLRQIAGLIDRSATEPVLTSLDGPLAAASTQLKADAFHRPFAVVRQKACAALGAAMMAAVGLGRYASLAEAAAAWVEIEHVVEPRHERAPLLDSRYGLYCTLYPALKEGFARLARLREEEAR